MTFFVGVVLHATIHDPTPVFCMILSCAFMSSVVAFGNRMRPESDLVPLVFFLAAIFAVLTVAFFCMALIRVVSGVQ